MKTAYALLAGIAAMAIGAAAQPASALTMKECSAKYKSAQDAGVVGSMSWNEFRKAECGEGASLTLKAAKTKARAQAERRAARPEHATANAGPSTEECSVRYQAAKAAGTLGAMTWNEFRKAGCVARTAAPRPTKREAAATALPQTARVSEQECSARYQAAKAAGTLGAMTWNEFRKAGCPTPMARRSGSMMPTMGSIYPAVIARKYAGEPAGRARELTCRDQYEANKAAGIDEPKWTEQGGGYYSECNKRLSQP